MDARAVTDTAMANIAYTDVARLEQLKHGGDGAIREAAEQFESVFLGLWLKTMREAGAVFSEGNYLSSQTVDMHQEMLDSQWAIHVSGSGGLGLADVIERQLRGEPAPIVRDTLAPATAGAVDGRQRPVSDDRASFVDQVTNVARQVIGNSGIPVLGVVAQAVLETGWGQHVPHDAGGNSSNNLFGMKAIGWSGPSVQLPTREHEFGRWVERSETFRAYGSVAESIGDLRNLLLGNERYASVAEKVRAAAGDAAQEVAAFADALQESGYATDPQYAEKLKDIAAKLSSRYGVR